MDRPTDLGATPRKLLHSGACSAQNGQERNQSARIVADCACQATTRHRPFSCIDGLNFERAHRLGKEPKLGYHSDTKFSGVFSTFGQLATRPVI